MGQRLATPKQWAERLRDEDGIEITAKEIEERLAKAKRKGKDARSWLGEILRGILFSEKDVRLACRDLLGK